eukprot:5108691-Ditylum_brightwellii.AAC.1
MKDWSQAGNHQTMMIKYVHSPLIVQSHGYGRRHADQMGRLETLNGFCVENGVLNQRKTGRVC